MSPKQLRFDSAIQQNKQLSHSQRPGMGAIPYQGGTTFRVWAPNANNVFVAGTFNQWQEMASPLASEGNGYWSADVPVAKSGDEYRFTLQLGEEKFSRIDPYAREVTNSVGNGVIVDPGFDWGNEHFQLPAWNELVIYEMHIGTFSNDKKEGPGNFESAIAKLPYLQQLGINVVEVMPFCEFPGAVSWGYNPSHLFALESDYGGAIGFRNFVKTAHELGIGVIVDVVYNHLGPSDLDLWRFDGWYENEGGGIYFYNDWRGQTPWGATRPDYGRDEVRRYLRDNALMWFDEYHVDGLRWDATAYIHNVNGDGNPDEELPDGWSLMQWVNEEVHKVYPNALTIAEDLRTNEWITKDIGAGGAGFGAQWDSEFVHPIRQAVVTMNDGDRNMQAVSNALCHRYEDKAFARVVYTESHDEVANGKARIPEEIAPGAADSYFSRKRSTLGAAMALSAPGIPMIFQGQEFLEDHWFDDTKPLDWSRMEQFKQIHALYSDLIHLRRNCGETTRGLIGANCDVFHIDDEHKVIALHRWHEGGAGDSVVMVANFTNQAVQDYALNFPMPGTWTVRLNSDSQVYGDDYSNIGPTEVNAVAGENGPVASATLAVGPYSVLILSQSE
ncbi:MAG: alpha-amylase family glycosyl hydrolase [Caldilineaceae bacterium]